jgi:predicted nucleic acid-binding protein
VSTAVYDAGVLIAAERNERWAWAEHRTRLEMGAVLLVPSNVVAQVSRSPKQAQLRRFLKGCEVASFDAQRAHRAGALLGKTGASDVVDAAVVELASSTHGEIVTTDAEDIARLVAATGRQLRIAAR